MPRLDSTSTPRKSQPSIVPQKRNFLGSLSNDAQLINTIENSVTSLQNEYKSLQDAKAEADSTSATISNLEKDVSTSTTLLSRLASARNKLTPLESVSLGSVGSKAKNLNGQVKSLEAKLKNTRTSLNDELLQRKSRMNDLLKRL